MNYLLAIHVLAATVWVGGMFFAHQCLRPVAASSLEPAQRLPLWRHVFARFFLWVWIAVIALPLTGYAMVFNVWDGFAHVGLHIKLMHHLGWVMVLIYLYVFFFPYRGLKKAVDGQNWPEGGKQLTRIRHAVTVNLILGLVVTAIASAGRHLV